jgi:stage II sporulation protein D
LEKQFKVPLVLSENSDATSSRIRVGEFRTREEAQTLLDTLKESGYPDAFIIGDIQFSHNGSATLALRGPDGLFKVSSSGFFFLPASDTEFLSLNGKAYRGFMDIRLNGSGRITAVNRLNIEQYLLGVVPAEMSPYEYPEFHALAAQSIAARTYALKHMGQYESQGFDLTDDTRTQVYGGVALERDASNEAVRRTAGIAVYYDNRLIDAMYMSTCGGRTEDFSEVYDASPVPYLTSVICTSEEGAHDDAITITGSHKLIAPFQTEDGRTVNRDLELAVILGIVEPGTSLSEDYLAGPISDDEAVDLIRAARRALGNSGKSSEPETRAFRSDTRAEFLAAAAESLFGFEEIRRSITSVDAAYYLGNLQDGDAVPEAAHRAIAFLMQKALWRPFPDNTVRPVGPISRVEAFSLILHWVESLQPDILRQGLLSGTSGPQDGATGPALLQIKWGDNRGNFPLAADLALFRKEGELEIPVNSLKVIGNEKSYFHLNADRKIDFLEIELNPTGASSDRYSPLATWETTLTRKDINDKMRNLAGDIGDIRDLQPARIGKSGRVVQVQVVGSRASKAVNGYRVRGALGLRDTLYTITRIKNPEGDVETFTFNGRGYGHGIGLCQVGAFGMAKAGKNFEEILKTYYQGVEVRKAY